LDKDVVLAEGYKEYDTGRTYMARMGDWRNNKDEEIELDGIGGVNILVKADVHRSGELTSSQAPFSRMALEKRYMGWIVDNLSRHQLPMLPVRKSSRDGGIRKNGKESWI